MARRRSFGVLARPRRTSGGPAASEVFVATNENVPARPGRSFRSASPTLGTAGREVDNRSCCMASLVAGDLLLGLGLRLRGLGGLHHLGRCSLLRCSFLRDSLLGSRRFLGGSLLGRRFPAATFFTAAFFAATFLVADFFAADFLAAGFFATGFLAADFRAAGFLAAVFLAAGFFAADFLAVAIVRLSSSSVGSGCPVKACRNASTSKSLFVACRKLFT